MSTDMNDSKMQHRQQQRQLKICEIRTKLTLNTLDLHHCHGFENHFFVTLSRLWFVLYQ